MKSYFLAPINSRHEAIEALTVILPEQAGTWLLKDSAGDVIAYFSLVEHDETANVRTIQADISGRHFNEDSDVVSVLRQLQVRLGGEITNDA